MPHRFLYSAQTYISSGWSEGNFTKFRTSKNFLLYIVCNADMWIPIQWTCTYMYNAHLPSNFSEHNFSGISIFSNSRRYPSLAAWCPLHYSCLLWSTIRNFTALHQVRHFGVSTCIATVERYVNGFVYDLHILFVGTRTSNSIQHQVLLTCLGAECLQNGFIFYLMSFLIL